MAEVDEPGQVVFVEVGAQLLHHRTHRGAQDVGLQCPVIEDRGSGTAERVRVALQGAEEVLVEDHGHLHDLGEPAADLPVRKRRQEGGVVQGGVRRVVGAVHVLRLEGVDARLDAHADVHLADEGGVDLDVPDAPCVDGRGEADHVGDDAAADGEHHAVPVQPVRLGQGADALRCRERLVVLAGGHDVQGPLALPGVRVQVGAEPVAVQPVHGRADEGHDTAVLQVAGEEGAVRVEHSGGEVDPVPDAVRCFQGEPAGVLTHPCRRSQGGIGGVLGAPRRRMADPVKNLA